MALMSIPRSATLGASLAMAAALATGAAPAHAAGLPETTLAAGPLSLSGHFRSSRIEEADLVNEWRRCGWRGCYRRGWHRGWRGRRGVGAGDVIAGVAILGGIAAIASAANNNRRRDRDVVVVEREDRYDRDRRWREENEQRREIEELRRRTDEQEREIEYLRSRGVDARSVSGDRARQTALPPVRAPLTIEGAIDRCVEVVGIDDEVAGVEGVDRTGSGWSVRGRIADGESFDCRIGSDGQIEALENRGFSASEPTYSAAPQRAEGQWQDSRYADARAAMRGSGAPARVAYSDGRPNEPLVPLTSDRMPAYPGGPVPEE